MRTIEVLEKYPLAADAMRKWHHDAVIENANRDLPEEFMKELRDMIVGDDIVERIIDAGARNWFDFFDEQDLFINIITPNGKSFRYELMYNEATVGVTKMFSTRIEADKEAVHEAIRLLDDQLTKTVSDKENS